MTINIKHAGQDISTRWIDPHGVEIFQDLNRVWKGCMVGLNTNMWCVELVGQYKDEAVFVISCLTNEKFPMRVISSTHPKLEKQYPELGYFNLPTNCVYLSRRATRQWKQGLHINTIDYTAPFREVVEKTTRENIWKVSGNHLLWEYGIQEQLKKLDVYHHTYPTLTQALSCITKKESLSVALNLDVTIAVHPVNGELHIMYHNMSVGALDLNSREPLVIREDFLWLRDTLQEYITL